MAPESRIVYVDNDPLVLAHARGLLTSTPAGKTAYIDADLRDPDSILREAREALDFTQPIALMLMGIVEFVTDDDDEAYAIVDRLLDACRSGSYLALYDGTNVIHGEASDQVVALWNEAGSAQLVLRSPARVRLEPLLVGGSSQLARDISAAEQAHVEGAVDAAILGLAAAASMASTAILSASGYAVLAAAAACLSRCRWQPSPAGSDR